MSKQTRLGDFQVTAPGAHAIDKQREVNECLFATYEPVRLWLRAQGIEAPFRKLLVKIEDEMTDAFSHGDVTIGGGICEVVEAVPVAEILRDARDHRWVISLVKNALESVREKSGWQSKKFVEHLKEVSS